MKWLVIPFFLVSSLTSAQEAGAFVAQAWSNNAEVEDPLGFGIYLSSNPSALLVIGISFERFANDRTYEGYSTVFTPNPVWESINSSVRATMWKLRLSFFPLKYDYFSFGIGSAVSANWISISKRGVGTGNRVATEGGQKFGVGISLLARITPIEFLPLAVNIDGQRHFLSESTSVVTNTEMPFKRSMAITSLSIGISYFF